MYDKLASVKTKTTKKEQKSFISTGFFDYYDFLFSLFVIFRELL